MARVKPDTPEFLLQVDILNEVLPRLGKEQWQTLYLSSRDARCRLGIWCTLLDDNEAASHLSAPQPSLDRPGERADHAVDFGQPQHPAGGVVDDQPQGQGHG